MKIKLPVLIAVNTYDGHQYCREGFVKNLAQMQEDSGADVAIFYNGHLPWGFEKWDRVTYEPTPQDTGISILCAKNNMMRDYFLAGKWSYIFMLESDVIPPVDCVRKFYGYHQDVVTAIYFINSLRKELVEMPFESKWNILNRKENGWGDKEITLPKGTEVMFLAQLYIPTIWGVKNGASSLWRMEDVFPQRGLVRIFSAGIGAVLMKRQVLEVCGRFNLRDPSDELQNFTDFLYFRKIHDCGFQAFADTNTICRHEHFDWDSFVQKRWFDAKTLKAVKDPDAKI